MDIFALAEELDDEPFHVWLQLTKKSAKWAARELGVTPDYLSMIRTRKRRPSRELVRAMVKLSNKRLTIAGLATWHRLPDERDAAAA